MGKTVKSKKKSAGAPKPKSPRKLALEQLQMLIRRFPDHDLDIDGIIVDYLGRSGKSLDSVFELNPKLYPFLFAGDGEENGRRLLKVLGDVHVQRELAERCKKDYPLVEKILASNARKAPNPRTVELIQNPAGTLGYPVRSIVWHISDVHFGKFNKLNQSPRELAYFLAQLPLEYSTMLPDVVLISGDVSSVASEAEFEQFRLFCVGLSEALWKRQCPERILVVPGNHDVTWLPDGTADRLSEFRKHFSDDQVCISPFGAADREMGGGRFRITRVDPYPDTVPPVTVVHDTEKNIRFVLLVSGYFSGNVPADVRHALISSTGSINDISELLRIDEGEVTHEYLFNIGVALGTDTSTCFGVIHHNPVPYGIEMCRNSLAPKLMETLWKKGVPVLLHGHVHLAESRSNKRPAAPGQAYPIPAPTLTSVTTAGSGRGINVHFVGPDDEQLQFDTLIWSYSQSMAFQPVDAVWRYRVKVNPDACEVEHL